jgi:protein AroM
MPLVAAISIGQTPRPDLVEELGAVLPDGVELRESGALDGVDSAAIPPIRFDAENPLATRLAGGRQVIVDEAWIAPHLQRAVDRVAADGADLGLLLCAASFAAVSAPFPLVRPSEAVAATLAARGIRTALVVVPSPRQIPASESKWRALGIDPLMLGTPLPKGLDDVVEAAEAVPAVILDFVGHPGKLIDRLEDALESDTDALLYDLGRYGAFAVAERLATAAGAGETGR